MIFWNVLRIKWTCYHQLSLHSPSIDDLYHIHKILFALETSNKLCVIWAPEIKKTECNFYPAKTNAINLDSQDLINVLQNFRHVENGSIIIYL